MISPASLVLEGAEGNLLAADLWDGRGHPVVFLHGGGQTRRAWDRTAREVAENGMRAITVDLRGHGESDWVASGNYTFSHYAADVVALVEQISSRFRARPSAVGASLGGISSLAGQLWHGPLLETLVLVDITPRMNPEGVAKIQGFMGEKMDEGFSTLKEAADAIAAYLPHRKRPSSLEGLRKNLRLGPDNRYRWHWDPAFVRGERNINAGAHDTMARLLADLPKLHIPALLVRGMQSELVGEEEAREFVGLAPAASYVDVGGAGHMVAGDRNDVFCTAILEFLTDERAA